MKWSSWRYILGGALVLMGALALFQALGYISADNSIVGIIFGILFAAAGVGFLTVLRDGRENWWAAIPGVILLFLGLLILMGALFPGFESNWGSAFFLAGISLAFWVVYLLKPSNWWAIIPGGVMLTLAVVAGLDENTGLDTGGIFFLGLALTFFVLWLIPVEGKRMTWPWIPAAVLAVMGVLILVSSESLINYVWPLVLIVAGGILLGRAFLVRR